MPRLTNSLQSALKVIVLLIIEVKELTRLTVGVSPLLWILKVILLVLLMVLVLCHSKGRNQRKMRYGLLSNLKIDL